MNLEITGKLIEKYDTNIVSDKFRKREFVLELGEEINGNVYTSYAKMQLVQNKCDIIDRFNIGDNLKVNFNIRGTRYEKEGKVSYFSNLDAWRIEHAAAQQGNGGQQQGGYNGSGNGFQNNNNGGYNGGNNGGFQNNNNNNNGSGFGNSNGGNFSSQPAGNVSQDAPDDLPF
jgi:hypothetical protein